MMHATVDMIRDWQKRAGHNNAQGCVVCFTINMLIEDLEHRLPDAHRRVCDDGVIITEEAA